ncbi:MAG TPA: cell division protein FtsZ [Solirubrobacteraceae bacterium]|nr:cell division protein FtsZ [Solirubrobacteraceae bacterium]
MAPHGKRASMREGPLADLFRKTEEQDPPASEQAASGHAAPEQAAPEQGPPEPEPLAAEPAAPPPSEPPVDQPRADEPPGPEHRAAPVGEPQTAAAGAARVEPRESVEPTKSRAARSESADAVEPADHDAPRVPSPRERLRNVFSSEIPANVMDGAPAAIPAPGPAVDVYARDEARPVGAPAPSSGGSSFAHPVIRVVGVGGAGVNAVNRMVEAEVAGVEFLAINTDLQSLQQSTADITLHIGAELTRGLGSGSDTSLGRQAAMDDYDRAKALLKGSDMIFITAGAGGGTGTGAAPIIARIAREVGALAVAIVTKPFGFEGSRRAEQADEGVRALAEEVDTLIVVPNNRLLSVLDKQTSMVDAFRVADDVLRQGVQGISDLVTLPGLINLDFADVRTIMSGAGNALLGIGMGSGGEHRSVEAAMQAVSSPLLETSMEGARSILLSITGGRDLSLWEVNEAAKAVAEAAHPDANIIFGAMVDEKLTDQVWVTVVATGYADDRGARRGERGGEAGRLREPTGERGREVRAGRISGERGQRAGAGSGRRERGGGGLVVDELDVPEFMPRV